MKMGMILLQLARAAQARGLRRCARALYRIDLFLDRLRPPGALRTVPDGVLPRALHRLGAMLERAGRLLQKRYPSDLEVGLAIAFHEPLPTRIRAAANAMGIGASSESAARTGIGIGGRDVGDN